MSISNYDLHDGTILKDDLYKNNTLLLKKGSVINNHILQKLNRFGVYPQSHSLIINSISDSFYSKNILVIQSDNLAAIKTENILKFAGFSSDKILVLNSTDNLSKKIGKNKISYIFIDKKLFTQDFIQETFLIKSTNKIKIFVLNCEDSEEQNIKYNTEFQDIKFLHRPLANNYIKALLSLYS